MGPGYPGPTPIHARHPGAHKSAGRIIPDGNAYPSPGLASEALATPGLRPKRHFIPEGNAYGGPAFDSARDKDPLRGRAMPRGPRFVPYAIRLPARSPRPGLCNPYRIEFCLGSVTRGSHVPWQPRARICKSFRLVPAPDVFRLARPNFGSVVGSTTDSRPRPHDPRFLR